MSRYENAKREHEDLYARQAKSLHSWKMAFFASMILTICSFSIAGYLTTRSNLIPYVIEVDETGNAKGINQASLKKYIPTENEREYFLREFLKRARTLSSDVDVVNTSFTTNRFFLKPRSLKKYLQMIENEKINDLINENYTRDMQIQSLVKMANTENSYQIRWNETLIDGIGEIVQKRNYTGIFTITVEVPETLADLENNPLGIKILDFSLTVEK